MVRGSYVEIMLVRSATLVVSLGDQTLLVDPMLGAAGSMPPVEGQLAGRPTFVCRRVYLQGLLDLSPSGRLALVREPPGIALHVRRYGPALVSHVQPVGDYGTPLYESPPD